jgi:hypothetical protein
MEGYVWYLHSKKTHLGFQKLHPVVLSSHNSWTINNVPRLPQKNKYR